MGAGPALSPCYLCLNPMLEALNHDPETQSPEPSAPEPYPHPQIDVPFGVKRLAVECAQLAALPSPKP